MAILRGSVEQLGGTIAWERSVTGVICTIDLPAATRVSASRNGVAEKARPTDEPA
jgi:hypothetical protein